ncbi:unnamed protein product [Linum tenue]|uniref:Uncharacterized protein n=1 Tax=Linum tenue TaxID=586396 RepID=A0AAV0PS23_9ROSI|nr:unnamed protein product [Linum tenue]
MAAHHVKQLKCLQLVEATAMA